MLQGEAALISVCSPIAGAALLLELFQGSVIVLTDF